MSPVTTVSSLLVRMFCSKGPGFRSVDFRLYSEKSNRSGQINRYKAQRHLADVMIETEAPFDIEYRDPNLEKILKLSPADLRFIDALIAKVEGSDETEWVGSDQWIR